MSASRGGTVRLLPAGLSLQALPGETVVDAARRAGLRMPYACRRGGCGACLAVLEEGDICYDGPVAQSVLDEALADHTGPGVPCLPCRAVPQGHVTIRLARPDQLRRTLGWGVPPPTTDREGPTADPFDTAAP